VETLTIQSDELEVVVLPSEGARLHRLRAFGHDLLRTPADPAIHRSDPYFWGAYVMAPWCNRLEAAPIRVGSRTVDLPANFPDGSAIHGQLVSAPWIVEEGGRLRTKGGGAGWPWSYEASLEIALVGPRLRLVLELRNLSDEPMPAGLGLHPWFVEPVLVAVSAELVYPSNLGPPGRPEPVAGRYDLRRLGEMSVGLDAAWTSLSEPAVELVWPKAGLRATLATEGTARCIVAARLPSIPAIAVEPETHAPQGLRRLLEGLPDPLILLAPDERLRLVVDLTVALVESVGR
jgi:aldose 1-epimerase